MKIPELEYLFKLVRLEDAYGSPSLRVGFIEVPRTGSSYAILSKGPLHKMTGHRATLGAFIETISYLETAEIGLMPLWMNTEFAPLTEDIMKGIKNGDPESTLP